MCSAAAVHFVGARFLAQLFAALSFCSDLFGDTGLPAVVCFEGFKEFVRLCRENGETRMCPIIYLGINTTPLHRLYGGTRCEAIHVRTRRYTRNPNLLLVSLGLLLTVAYASNGIDTTTDCERANIQVHQERRYNARRYGRLTGSARGLSGRDGQPGLRAAIECDI